MNKPNFEMVVTIMNAGFADTAMDAAKAEGARGGTIVRARGTASPDAERFFNITIQPEKEMLLILVPVSLRDKILSALYSSVGQSTPAQGISFSLPVDDTAGLSAESGKE